MERKRVLIVDDEAGSSRLLKANLDLVGRFEVRVENQPEKAVEAARQFQPEVALLDVIMPQMSGTSLAEAFQADPELKPIRIVFLTAAAPPLMNEEVTRVLRSFPCIFKPASLEDILPYLDNNQPP
jgi:two-component system, OmpR family, response regulator